MVQLIIRVSQLRGERTATAMETQLTALERKIDDLLASVDVESTENNAIMNEQEKSHQEQSRP